MIASKRPSILVALGSSARKPMLAAHDDDTDEDAAPDPKQHAKMEVAAGQALLDAIDAKDARAVADAVGDLCELHEYAPSEDDGADDEDM